jgi:hypothetical protein
MARQFSLPELLPPVSLLTPAADAAGRTSRYVKLGKCDKAWIVCHVNQGNAATVALTPLQASDTSGTGSKGLTAAGVQIWTDLDEATLDLFAKQANAASFTTDAATKDKIVIFEISPQDCMDMAGGFNTIAIQTGASNAANITQAAIYPLARYQQAQPPTILS